MKTMKKIASMALALVMLMALAVPAMAAPAPAGEAEKTDYTLTISKPSDITGTTTYKVYRVFDATTNDDGNISYTIRESKKDDTLPSFFTELYGGYVIYNAAGPNQGAGPNQELKPEEVQAIRQYVEGDEEVYEVTILEGNDEETIYVTPGYYFVTTSSGTAVSVDSTNKDAVVKDKTEVPTIKKEITGTSANEGPLTFGSTIDYKVTITVGDGAEKYVLHDQMGSGLEMKYDTIVVKYDTIAVTSGVEYEVVEEDEDVPEAYKDYAKFGDDDRFIIVFKDPLNVSEIEVTYSATIDTLDDLTNFATVTYGESQNEGTTPTPTDPDDLDPDNPPNKADIKFVTVTINKIDSLTRDKLPGAKFTISRDGKYYNDDGSTWGEEVELVTGEEGTITFISLADGVTDCSYTLIETEAPAGYNRLEDDITIKVAANGTVTVDDKEVTSEDAGDNAVTAEFNVENGRGSLLPSTGGIGTTIFTVAGGALMLGAAVLFITKKRSANG